MSQRVAQRMLETSRGVSSDVLTFSISDLDDGMEDI